MSIIKRDAYHCDRCGYEWLPKPNGKGEWPKQCPNRKCRSRMWNLKGGGELATVASVVIDKHYHVTSSGPDAKKIEYCPECYALNGLHRKGCKRR